MNSNDPDKSHSTYPYKGGNKPRDFDKMIFEGLCNIQCTIREMMSVFRCCYNTLDGWCWRTYGQSVSEVREWLALEGNASLRRTQWQQGKRHWGMAIFLGKQYLGQADKVVTTTQEDKTKTKLDATLTGLHDTPAEEFGAEPREDYAGDQSPSVQPEASPELPGSDSQD